MTQHMPANIYLKHYYPIICFYTELFHVKRLTPLSKIPAMQQPSNMIQNEQIKYLSYKWATGCAIEVFASRDKWFRLACIINSTFERTRDAERWRHQVDVSTCRRKFQRTSSEGSSSCRLNPRRREFQVLPLSPRSVDGQLLSSLLSSLRLERDQRSVRTPVGPWSSHFRSNLWKINLCG